MHLTENPANLTLYLMQRLSKTNTISICAVEIYNEKIRDLLVPFTRKDDPASECEINSLTKSKESNSADVKLMGQFQLRHKDKSDLREVKVHSVHDAMYTLSDALQSRTCRGTKYAPIRIDEWQQNAYSYWHHLANSHTNRSCQCVTHVVFMPSTCQHVLTQS